MKKYYPKFDRRHQAKALSLLAGLFLCPLAGMATDPTYVNNGTINNANIPQIDATNFVNTGSWNINTVHNNAGWPYETSHTLNYTNTGTMIGSVGWEFDYGPLPPNGGRGMSANFVNNSAGASIQAVNGQILNPVGQGVTSSLFNLDYLWISATNIVNKGTLQADAYGEIKLAGSNVNLSRSIIEIVPVPVTGSFNNVSNYSTDVAIYDEYWGTGLTNLNSGAVWNGSNAASATLPSVDVTNKCSSAVNINGGALSFFPTKSAYTNMSAAPLMLTITNSGNAQQIVPIITNIFRQAVFVATRGNVSAAIGFTPGLNPTNLFQTVTVQLSNTVSVGSLFLVDTLGSASGRGVLPVNTVFPLDECGALTYRPTNYIVERSFSGSIGSPGQTNPPLDFLFNTNWAGRIIPNSADSAYSFFVDNGVSGFPVQSNPSITNAQGRVNINANILNLDHAQILQPVGAGVPGDGLLTIKANQVLNSQTAIIQFKNLNFDLGSTNGNLNITNLVSVSSLTNGFNGTVSEWSAVWTNLTSTVVTNYLFDTNIPPTVTMQLITNTVQINLHAFLVDARQLQTASSVTVFDLLLHSTNIVLGDSMTVANPPLFDGKSLTLLGNLTLNGSMENWTAANAPNLLYFTNNGFLSIPGDAHFGDDTAVPYIEFVNAAVGVPSFTNLTGIIVANDQTIDSQDIQIVNGINYCAVGDFTATASSIEIIGPTFDTFFPYAIYAVGNINLTASTLLIDPASLLANQALNFNITTNLSDNGMADNFTCYNGFNLWVKPIFGDLLGSTVTSIASGDFTEVDHAWAGQDRGLSLAGYTNNVAIGTLVLSPQNFTGTEYPLFRFYGTGPGSNAMYVVTLDLSQFTSSNELAAAIEIDPGLKIYFQNLIPPGINLPGGQSLESFLQSQFAGQFVKAPNFAVAQSGMVVNGTNTFQRIDGFGASSAWHQFPFWTTAQADLLFSTNNGIACTDYLGNTTTNNGIGLSLLRSRIAPGGTTVENSIMQMAQARGARVWSSPWSPAAGFKSTNNIYGTLPISNPLYGGSILATAYSAYANQLASYVVNMTNVYGVKLYAISIQNEPDAQVNGYEACQWTPQEIHDFIPFLHNALVGAGVGSTLIMLPESQNWPDYQHLANTAMNDPIVAANVGIVADHNYDFNNGVDGPDSSLLPKNSYGKALWETEVAYLSGSDSSMNNGAYWAARIYLFMTQAQVNAYHYWWLIAGGSEGNQGLLDNNAAITKRLFAMGQYSRFVRPGYYRIGVNTVNSNLLVSAYEDTNSLNFAIIAVNNTPNVDITQTFSLTNLVVTSVTPWITSSTQSLAPQAAVPVTDGTFQYLIPAKSVVTFVGQATSTSSSLRPALQTVPSQTINAGVTLTVTNVATDPNAPPAVTFSLLAGPTNATLGATFNYTNAVFTWRPLVSQADTTNLITVKVVDSASQSAIGNFTVIVNPLSQPSLSSIVSSGGQINLAVKGPAGPDYTLWTSTNLVNWQALSTTNSPQMPLTLTVTNHNDRMRFYRLQLGP